MKNSPKTARDAAWLTHLDEAGGLMLGTRQRLGTNTITSFMLNQG